MHNATVRKTLAGRAIVQRTERMISLLSREPVWMFVGRAFRRKVTGTLELGGGQAESGAQGIPTSHSNRYSRSLHGDPHYPLRIGLATCDYRLGKVRL